MKGQTMVELLVALGIAALVLVAVVAGAISALSNVMFSRSQGESNRYARESLEWLRGQRDTGWTTFSSKASASPGTTWCLKNLDWLLPGTCSAADTIPNTTLFREATLTTVAANDIDITIIVSWSDSRGSHQTRLNSKLTKWK